MKFSTFSALCANLENTSSTTGKTTMISDFLSTIPQEQIESTIRLLAGIPVYPPELKSGIGDSTIKQAIADILNLPLIEVTKALKESGDIGTATMTLLKKKNLKKQSTLAAFEDQSSTWSISQINEQFNTIASTNGALSSSKKTQIFSSLLTSLSPQEAKYVCRLALEDLRIGVAASTIINAIAEYTQINAEIIERAYNLTNDIGMIASLAITKGQTELTSIQPETGRYIRVMLGQTSKDSLESIIKSTEKPACEWKYDGARLQIHKKGKNVKLYSKKPEDITNSLPDIVKAVQKQILCEEAILEGEVVAIDDKGNPLPFKTVMQRIRRKNNISAYVQSTPLCVYLFEILKNENESLIDLPLHLRRKQLEKIISPSENINLSKQLTTTNTIEIEQMYTEALQAGHEGIMIKNLMSPYTAGKRGKDWIKKKPLMNNLDLVITGGEWGQGRRTNVIGSFTLSCLDPTTNTYLSVSKIGTGISDELLQSLTETLRPYIEYETGTEIKISPKVVLEVSYEEIQESPKYNSGYSLRFPRLVNVRDEKGPDAIDQIHTIKRLFREQSRTIG